MVWWGLKFWSLPRHLCSVTMPKLAKHFNSLHREMGFCTHIEKMIFLYGSHLWEYQLCFSNHANQFFILVIHGSGVVMVSLKWLCLTSVCCLQQYWVLYTTVIPPGEVYYKFDEEKYAFIDYALLSYKGRNVVWEIWLPPKMNINAVVYRWMQYGAAG